LGIVGPFSQKLGKILFNFLVTLLIKNPLAGEAGQENDLNIAKTEQEKWIQQIHNLNKLGA
jgi:hypothetical protein